MIQYDEEGALHKDEAEEMSRRWVQVGAARRQALAVFAADLGVKMAQQGHESLRGHLEGLIIHP